MGDAIQLPPQPDAKPGRKITILGMGPTANERRIDILKYCAGTEIWGLNNGYLTYPHLRGHWARFFELHAWNYLDKVWKDKPATYFHDLDALDCPVYVGQPIPVVRKQVTYDFVKVFRHFGCNYFLGSPSLMLALAIYEHDHGQPVSEIRSWGIDTSDPQHGQQRASWSWWVSKADERGIDFTGTALAFMAEYEKDDGLRGLREKIGDAIQKENEKKENTK